MLSRRPAAARLLPAASVHAATSSPANAVAPRPLPAVAEELLFRGYLLTALESKLGRVDRVAVAGALFAAIHLSPEQFFPFAVLGFACGAAATATDSVVPAVLLHLSYNVTALVVGLQMMG
jgi:membrane protease YdiL (CAAX protease family)